MSAQVSFLEEMDRAEPIVARNWLNQLNPADFGLRDYQMQMVARTADAMQQFRRILIQAPTGAGKSRVITAITGAAQQADLRVLILATRTRLVRQLHDNLDAFHIQHGIMAAAMPGYTNWSHHVQIASVDTLYRRCLVDQKTPLPSADVIVFDESQLALGASRQAILNSYSGAWLFGFTATPATISGKSLKEQFETLILGPSPRDLIASGCLVKPRVFNIPGVSEKELQEVGTDSKTGDYKTGNLSRLMAKPKLVGDVLQNWLRIANGKRTIIFACDKAHGAKLTEEFRQAGVACEQLTDSDSEDTREASIARLERGHTTVLVNCFLLSYGIDIPRVECIVLARPTRSVVLYLQTIGRGMRPFPGKDSVIFIDHGRVADNLGHPHIDRYWSLIGKNANLVAREETAHLITQEQHRNCAECSASWLVSEDGPRCPSCGWTPAPRAMGIRTLDAELLESNATKVAEQRDEFFAMSCQWFASRWPERWKTKPGSGRWWAWIQTKTKFKLAEDTKIPQRYWTARLQDPSLEVSGWLKSQQIRWAKHRQKLAREAKVSG